MILDLEDPWYTMTPSGARRAPTSWWWGWASMSAWTPYAGQLDARLPSANHMFPYGLFVDRDGDGVPTARCGVKRRSVSAARTGSPNSEEPGVWCPECRRRDQLGLGWHSAWTIVLDAVDE